MDRQQRQAATALPANGAPERNRLEIIRFATADAQRHAIRVLLECGNLNLSSTKLDEWAVRTDVVRALQAGGVAFEWLTENV